MKKTITVTDAVKSFSDIVGRVYYKRETFDIKKGANIVARLSPVGIAAGLKVKDLNTFFLDSPRLAEEDIEAFEKDAGALRALKDDGGLRKWD